MNRYVIEAKSKENTYWAVAEGKDSNEAMANYLGSVWPIRIVKIKAHWLESVK